MGGREADGRGVPLSAKEQALWLFHQYAGDVGVLNVPFAVRFKRHIQAAVLTDAVAVLVRRHPALRTLFPDRDGAPTRLVLDPDDPRATVPVQVRASTAERLDDDLARFTAAPFDLANRPAMRVGQFVTEIGDIVCVVVDHLVYDAYSGMVLRRELLELCGALQAGAAVPEHLTGEVTAPEAAPRDPAGIDYWRRHLAGADENRPAPAIGRAGDRAPDFPGARVAIPLSTHTDDAVHALLADESVSLNIIALAAYVLLLSRHGAGDDVVVAVPVNGRGSRPHDAVGYFMDIMAVRVPVDERATFRELVRACQEVFLTGMMHGQVSVDEALAGAYGHGAGWRQPLLRHMFNFTGEMFQLSEDSEAETVVRHPVHPRHSRMDLELIVGYRADRFEIGAAYAADVFTAEEINALLNRYEQILRTAAANFDEPVADIPLWTDADRDVVRGATPSAGAVTPVPERFLEHALLSPGAPVITGAGGTLTRAGLSDHATRLAGRLRAHGTGPGAVAGVATGPGAPFLAAALASWGAGAAVLPLDPHLPAERLTAWLDDAGATLVVGDLPLDGRLVLPPVAGDAPGDVLDPVADDDPALVLPTSSGPVRVDHGALGAMAADLCDLLAIAPGDTVAWRRDPADDPGWPAPLLALTGGAHLLLDDSAPADILFAGATADIRTGVRVVVVWGAVPAGLAARAAAVGARVVSVLAWPQVGGPALVATGDGGSYRPVAGITAAVRDPKGRHLPPGVRGALRLAGPAGEVDTGMTAMWRLDGGLAVVRPDAGDEPPAGASGPDDSHGELVSELVGLYRTILKDHSLQATDSFFTNGGNSLLAARLVSQIRKRTGTKVPLRTVFRANTPARLAQEIARLVTPDLSTQDTR